MAVAGCREPAPPPAIAPSSTVAESLFVERETLDGSVWSGSVGALISEFMASEVYIPGGEADGIRIEPYYLDVTETTIVAYRECVAGRSCSPAKDGTGGIGCKDDDGHKGSLDFPVNCVSRLQAIAYCEWVGKRLPTGAELKWEAAGGEENRLYPWGDAEPNCSHGNFGVIAPGYDEWCGEGVESVGSYPAGASAHGVLDMEGNLSEWVSDTGYKMIGHAGMSYVDTIEFGQGFGVFNISNDRASPTIGIRCARDAD